MLNILRADVNVEGLSARNVCVKASVNPGGSNLPRRLVNATPTALSPHATRFIPPKFHSTLCSIKKSYKKKI